MKRVRKSKNGLKGWSIKLPVSPEEEKRIRKEAIDYDMRVSDYIRYKVLGDFSQATEGKSS